MDNKADNKHNADFDEYRRKMHAQDGQDEGRKVVPSPSRSVGIAFGIFMIIVYVGVGVLLLINFFNWTSFDVMRYILAIVLIIYGVFRAYRMFVGSN